MSGLSADVPGWPGNPPLLCAITNRTLVRGATPGSFIRECVAAGVDLVQIRERSLPARELTAFVREAVREAKGTATRILVNDRLDVALAAGAQGIHLPARGLPTQRVRSSHPEMLIGVSAHTVEELEQAEANGAAFALFAPVFEPLSKTSDRPPLGIEGLREAVLAVHIPVLALGGITEENAADCLTAGAAGIAGITLFQGSPDLAATVRRLRAAVPG